MSRASRLPFHATSFRDVFSPERNASRRMQHIPSRVNFILSGNFIIIFYSFVSFSHFESRKSGALRSCQRERERGEKVSQQRMENALDFFLDRVVRGTQRPIVQNARAHGLYDARLRPVFP